MSNILSIGKSALIAAQVSIDTTGHNIANASTVGYSRQIVVQGAVAGQDMGFGYLGKGTEVVDVRRVYSDYLTGQVRSAQTTSSELNTYYTQIQQIDNMLADSTVGLSPSLQNFFDSIQDVSSNPSSTVSRQSMLSSAEALVTQFQSLSQQLTEISQGVNSQIKASTTSINSYATQIAQLNHAIEMAMGTSEGKSPNDLLDQRDQLLAELSKEVRVSLVKQNNSYDVYIGNGQPLVVGNTTYSLENVVSPTDPSRIEVAYKNSDNSSTILSTNTISGGNLSGLLNFRSETLDAAQNAIGRIATVMATAFNEQHRLGIDLNAQAGEDFFKVGGAVATASSLNDKTANALVNATITDAKLLTTSNYSLNYDGSTYTMSRLSDGKKWTSTDASGGLSGFVDASGDAMAEGFTVELGSGTIASGDSFLIKPTAYGAANLGLNISDTTKIAAAGPITSAVGKTNTGTAKFASVTVDADYLTSAPTLPVTLIYDASSGMLDTTPSSGEYGFPMAYTSGTPITFNGVSFTLTSTPANGDTFTLSANTSGVGDNRNALLLGALQTTKLVAGSTATFQTAYSQLVNTVGNKTSELEITSASAETLYNNAYTSQQAESGVNLDEEAANLIRYQQAYQAAAKVMQVASDLFDSLLAIRS